MQVLDLNVNGYNAFLEKGGAEYISNLNPDIVCLQEIKTQSPDLKELNYPYIFSNPGNIKNQSGTMICSRIKPVQDLTGEYDFSKEGRMQVIEYDNFILVNVYVPNPLRSSKRQIFRERFDSEFVQLVNQLNDLKPVMIFGDFNCVYCELDKDCLSHDREEKIFGNSGNIILHNLAELGFYDPFRKLYRDKKGVYSWRSPKNRKGFGSKGRRLDYCYLSRYLPKTLVESVNYFPEACLSDHYPMLVSFKSFDSLEEDSSLRKEWEEIDLKQAETNLNNLIEQAKDGLKRKDEFQYASALKRIATSKDIKALAVNASVDARYTQVGNRKRNQHYTVNKMKTVREIDLENYCMDPVYYFKTEEKGKIRLIGKLTVRDRSAHFIVAQMVKPFHELSCDKHSFAYIEGRSNIDLHNLLCSYLTDYPELNYIAVLDIKEFYFSLDHDLLCRLIPIPPVILRNVLETVNVIDNNEMASNGKGISMGSPLASYCANIMLNGIEKTVVKALKNAFGPDTPVRFLRFSDDIIILTNNKAQIDFAVETVKEFLYSRKLELNTEKSFTTNFRKDPFVLMNWEYRFCRGNLVVRPTQKRLNIIKRELRRTILVEPKNKKRSVKELIEEVNKKISGLANYFRYCDAGFEFYQLDQWVEDYLKWKLNHSGKGQGFDKRQCRFWIHLNGTSHFCSPTDKTVYVKKFSEIPLIKEPGEALKLSKPVLSVKRANGKNRGIWLRQEGRCAVCGENILENENRIIKKIDGRSCYIHSSCKNKKVFKDRVVFDLTTPTQVEKALLMEEPYLDGSFKFNSIKGAAEERRRRLHRTVKDNLVFTVDSHNTKSERNTKTGDRRTRTNHDFSKSCRYEGFVIKRLQDKIFVRRARHKKLVLEFPEWLKDYLSEDNLLMLTHFLDYLKSYYKL